MRHTTFGRFGIGISLALLAAALATDPAQAAMIVTGGEVLTSGGAAPVGAVSFNLIGGGGSASAPFKLSGGGSFVSNGTPGEIIFRTTGTIQFIPGEEWHVAWDFSTDLPAGSATWKIDWESNCPIFGAIRVASPQVPVPGGHEDYDGDFGFINPLFWTSMQPFRADIVVDWAGAPGDTFTITIPDNSIDFAVGTVPEPAALGLLAMGGPALALGRRRRQAASAGR